MGHIRLGALITVAVNLVAPVLIMLGIRTRPASLVLALVTAAGLYLLHRVDLEGVEFQRSVAIIGGLLLVWAVGPGGMPWSRDAERHGLPLLGG